MPQTSITKQVQIPVSIYRPFFLALISISCLASLAAHFPYVSKASYTMFVTPSRSRALPVAEESRIRSTSPLTTSVPAKNRMIQIDTTRVPVTARIPQKICPKYADNWKSALEETPKSGFPAETSRLVP